MQRVDRFLQHAVQTEQIPGAVLCVAHRGNLVWHQVYGAAARCPQHRPMHRETLFDLASLSKVVATTTLLLVAHAEGVCALDDPLCRFYPQLAHTPRGSVTLAQLLAHTGGFEAWHPLYQTLLPDGPAARAAIPWRTRRRLAAQQILQRPLVYPPGSRALYSDLGFILLGDILETLYQQTLDALFAHRVARPLGLQMLAFRPEDAPSPLPDAPQAYAATEACPWRQRVLCGEVHDENAWAMGGVAGHAGLFGTAESLWRFAQALTDTAASAASWLPPALVRTSWQRYPGIPDSTRALGWDTPTPGRSSAGTFISPQAIGHLGFTGCSLWIDPVPQVIIVLCTNRVHPTRQATGIGQLRPAVHNLIMQALGVATS